MGAADVLLVERRLRSGSRGVKRLSEREPSPIARRLRTHRGTAGLGGWKRDFGVRLLLAKSPKDARLDLKMLTRAQRAKS